MGKGKESAGSRRVRLLFDILLLQVNCIGIVGALTEILEIPRDDGGERFLLWGVLFGFCAVSVFFWNKEEGKKVLPRRCAIGLPYISAVIFFRETLSGGTALALQNAVSNLNTRYRLHIVWPDGLALLREAGWEEGAETWIVTVSVLGVLFPLVLLAAFLLLHADGFWTFLLHGLWFTAACACNRFPDTFFLVFCVSGMVAALVRKDFEDNPGAGIPAVICVVLVAVSGMGLIYRFLLPVVEAKYEEGYEDRRRFYDLVNGEWIPKLRGLLPDYGFGSGPDVAGAFNRQPLTACTTDALYRVTVDSAPGEFLYLKGYVGGTYGKTEWGARPEGELRKYYKEHGMELPEDLGLLVSIGYAAAGGSRENIQEGKIRIEELAGKGNVSIYPYGAMLTDDCRVRGDGSVVCSGREYGFTYCLLGDILGTGELQEPWKTIEEQYRLYVYDSFLEYPRELVRLAEGLDQADIRRGDVRLCAADIVDFLGSQASYSLDAGQNPSGEDFVEYFLFDSHEGYCVHFASAAVLAFRYFGIPARYVSGYMAAPSDFYGEGSGSYTAVVTGKQAHAWAEIYIDGKGWVPVEATPGMWVMDGDDSVEAGTGREEAVNSWIRNGDQGHFGEEVLEDSEPEQSSVKDGGLPGPGDTWHSQGTPGSDAGFPVSGEDGAEKSGTGGEGPPGTSRVWRFPSPIIIVLFLLFMACFPGIFLCVREKRRWRGALQEAGERKRILLLYRNMRRALHIAGCTEGPDEDEEDFWRILRKFLPEMERGEYDSLCAILEKAGFGNAEPSEEEACLVSGFHDRLVKEVYKVIPYFKKPLYAVLVH